jgi:AbrB family looped-hinge helix DNA binding protein
MIASALGEKGRITIPQQVREAAGLRLNDQVEWRFEDGEIRGRKLVRQSLKKVRGKLVRKGDAWVFELPKGYSLEPDAIEKAVREERDSRA